MFEGKNLDSLFILVCMVFDVVSVLLVVESCMLIIVVGCLFRCEVKL